MSASATQGGHNYCTNSLSQLNKYGTLNIHYPGTRRVVKNYPGSLLPGYPTGTRVPAAALFGATETWAGAAAGLLSQARRRTTSCGNGWLQTMRRHV